MDLNLLRIFVAIFEKGSVTHAAIHLHMAQPSVTQALNRLRRIVGEPLFVRTGRGITPTRTARQLYREVGGFPATAEAAIRRLSNFTPAQTNETFHIALTDLGQAIFLPVLYSALTSIAPQSKLDIINLDTSSAVDHLKTGEVDLVVSSTMLSEEVQTTVIREEVYCCVTRRGRFDDRIPTFEELTLAPRIVVKDSIGHTVVESKLPPPSSGSLYLPAFSAIPDVLRASDLIAFVPRGIVELWARSSDLVEWPLPHGEFGSLVRAHTASVPRSASSAWFTRWAITTLQAIPVFGPELPE